jgi:hygromycin-B 4-O-kinase
MTDHSITDSAARDFIESHYGRQVGDVEYVGEGAWSRCFGFTDRGRSLVVRFGRHLDDFEKDRHASSHRSPLLPIPEVLEIGQAFEGFFAISTRACGQPLESLNTEAEWRDVLPSLFAALDSMRRADLSRNRGYGGWDARGNAGNISWREFMLAVGEDSPASRTHGWRRKLADAPGGDALFDAGLARLGELVTEDLNPRHLVHADLLNRNALVEGGQLSAVFDWGCSHYGDFLYDIAWFEFWAPWYPALESVVILDRFEEHCVNTELQITQFDSHMQACLIRIGLDHLSYHAHTGRLDELQAVAARMEPLLS